MNALRFLKTHKESGLDYRYKQNDLVRVGNCNSFTTITQKLAQRLLDSGVVQIVSERSDAMQNSPLEQRWA